MPHQFDGNVEVLNEGWPDRYTMLFDAIVDGETIPDIVVVANPPVTDAQVHIPDGVDATSTVAQRITNAALWTYYDLGSFEEQSWMQGGSEEITHLHPENS